MTATERFVGRQGETLACPIGTHASARAQGSPSEGLLRRLALRTAAARGGEAGAYFGQHLFGYLITGLFEVAA